ncbi:hypothetical protein CVT25_013406 [Psilocybe cyanescens]|uniref:DUF5648 domain-containing protein n=1 Tax=Psilocybe cyanescens TaxID=93625 RepID=A0A409WSR8_PSICY|nr:hypothetical protein CVT25_013406 [Psilocybe cyanescens]
MGCLQRRAEDTCGDPSLAVIFVEGFSRTLTAHNVNFLADFVNADTINTGTVDYEIQGEIFRAWKTPQINTVPLFRMGSDTLASDIILATSTTTDPPTVPGFPVNFGLIAYVYTTQICSSVPLYQLSLPARTDHWVTTDSSERDALVNFGWTDEGIVSYVLPLYVPLAKALL